jgi:hypothetical protein
VKHALALVAIGLAGCAHDENYEWDQRSVLCSEAVDDMLHPLAWDGLTDQMKQAAEQDRVLLVHAHTPGVTISREALDRLLSIADQNQLTYFTYRDLVPGPAQAGIALAFDDNSPDEWLTVQDILAAHGARVTYFVSRWALLGDAAHQEIHQLADAGHDIEPHSVHHLHAESYVAGYGLQAYIIDEVLPSITALDDAGFESPTTYAYPFGDRSFEMDALILSYVAKVRTTPGKCPY